MPVSSAKRAELADRVERFVPALIAHNFNGTKAAISIGVPPKSASAVASQLLATVNVQERLAAELQTIRERHNVTIDDVVMRFNRWASSNMEDYTRLDDNGDRVVDLSNCTREQMACVQSITVDEYIDGKGDDAREVKRTTIRLYDAKDANDKLLRFLGGYNGKEAPQQHNHYYDNRTQTVVVVNAADAAKDYKQFLGR